VVDILRRLFSVIKQAVSTIGESDPRQNTYLAKLFHKPRYDEIVSIVKEHVGDSISILIDVGCGKGVLYDFLVRAGVRVEMYICCDIKESYLREAKERGVIGIFCDAHNLPFRKGIADLVICSEVLEHLEEPSKAILSIFRVAGKSVLITFPNERVKNALGFRYSEHISEIRLKDLVYYANRLGYETRLHKRLYFAFPTSILDKVFRFTYQRLLLFSAFLSALSLILRELCLIKTEVVLFTKSKNEVESSSK
jgi:ubiquinone/menaquinone biosynthesis C-methylase UbiE